VVNGLRLSGELGMPDGNRWADFPSLNGPRSSRCPHGRRGAAAIQVDCTMSAGFPGYTAGWL
jgi:hypothetical protein